jgi:hypothetical protein
MVTALHADLRWTIEQTPKSGALNAGKRRLYVNRFCEAVKAREENDDAWSRT